MKRVIALTILMILFLNVALVNSTLAFSFTNEEFAFYKSEYIFRGEGDGEPIDMILPYGYDINDVEFSSADPDIAEIIELGFEDMMYIVEAHGIGETEIMARIPGTDYIAYSKVVVENPIKLTVEKADVGVDLKIDSCCDLWFSLNTFQAVEILVEPLDYEGEAEWIRLGQSIYGYALNDEYEYHIEENCKVTVRQISWWRNESYDGEIHEIVSNSIVIDDVEPISSIGGGINIYQEDGIDTVTAGETLQLKADLLEIPTDETIEWKSYNTDVAQVDENGYIYTIIGGEAKIEASVTIGDVTYRDIFTLTVEEEKEWLLQIFPSFENIFGGLLY